MEGSRNIQIHFKLPCQYCQEEIEYSLLDSVLYGGANRARRCWSCGHKSILNSHPRFLPALESWAEFSAMVAPESEISRKVKAYIKRLHQANQVRASSKAKA